MYCLYAVILAVYSLRAFANFPLTLDYDNNYDNGDLSLDSVACSDGTNGLESKDYKTLGSLPAFPYVGGVFTVTGWNSTYCGACYTVVWGPNTINILAVDVSRTGFTVSEEAMNTLTGGQAFDLGVVDVTYALNLSVFACNM